MKRDLPTYYGQPALKPSPYKFLVALYVVVGGLSGAAQVIAAFTRDRTLARNGRWMAAAGGAVVGPALLVLDLHTPRRWYNMLRIFRRTSPMSIGTYILSAFGGASVAALTPLRPLAQPAAAFSALGMTAYTAPLLSATATPLWAATPRALGVQFAGSSFATAAAALSLVERREHPALASIACTATVATLAATAAAGASRKRQDVSGPRGRWGLLYKAGLALSLALPLACYASGRSSRLAAAGILAGTLLSRWALFQAGNESAKQPQEHLRFSSHGR
ncbi:MAG TPA: hypothetical protein VM489_03795 [Burkholderiales bacterium]|nr:hypothetical protein [Burkholderiales bacterium]